MLAIKMHIEYSTKSTTWYVRSVPSRSGTRMLHQSQDMEYGTSPISIVHGNKGGRERMHVINRVICLQMMTTKAMVTPNLLSWARRRRGIEISDLAARMGVPIEVIAAWERGDKKPTFRQAQMFARKLYVPFGYLYLREPPTEKMPLADFRTTGQGRPDPTPDILDLLNDVLGKQQWLREYRKLEGASNNPFVGRFGITDSETVVADDIRDVLCVGSASRQASDWEGCLQNIVRNAEESGIMVMRSGVIRGNNRRPLNRGEFRGFSISDEVAPLVFINSRDFKGAQIFTLAHEMAHIWTGSGGVSNPDYGLQHEQQESAVERFCNRVAAETLVPSEDFLSRWRPGNALPEDNLKSLSMYYKVSTMVILRQALDNKLIDAFEYQRRYVQLVRQAEVADADRKATDEDAGKSGGNLYRTLIARNGRMFTEAVITSAAQGTTLSGEAAHMLGVKVRSLSGIAEYLSKS